PLFLPIITPPPRPTPFPYTTLFRSITDPGWSGNRAIYPDDIAATIYSALGIDWTKSIDDTPSGRRFNYINNTGARRSIVDALGRSEEHTSELQSLTNLVCRLLL